MPTAKSSHFRVANRHRRCVEPLNASSSMDIKSQTVVFLWLGLLHASCFAIPVGAQQQINVLSLDRMTAQSDVTIFKNESLIRDEDESTSGTVGLTSSPAFDLTYGFDPETVTIHKCSISTTDLRAKQATVEILASTLSPTTGFKSLRVEPLRASGKFPQTFSFDPTAARWIMVRISKTDPTKDLAFSIAELSLNGHEGVPVSIYQFNESPVKAIKVLGRLSESIKVELTEEEELLFRDAADGKFDEFSFAEASLMSSGVTEKPLRQRYLDQIESLEREVSRQIPESLSPFEKGQRLLDWLHRSTLNQGYVELQTDVSVTLDSRTFNCVSSATLYNILARRIGLDARGIEVPDHAFSILYDRTKHADIETTSPRGFNPARNRSALQEFQSQTGFVYIPDSNRSKRREVGETGLVAITFYNHGVTEMKAGQHDRALTSFFKTLSLDPKNKSAVKNILATLGIWSAELSKSGDTQKAISVLETGLELAPEDRTLKHNREAAWHRHLEKLINEDEADEALQQLQTAYEKTKDADLGKLQSWVFVKQGQSLAEQKNWEAALEIADEGLSKVTEVAQKELAKWKTYLALRWSTDLLSSEQFAKAIDVVERGLESSTDYKLNNRLAYLTQQYCQHEYRRNGIQAGQRLANSLLERFPKHYQVQRAATSFSDRAAAEFIEAKDYENALKVYADAREFNPSDAHLKRNEEAVWVMMAKPSLESKNWKSAIEIYERAYNTQPTSSLFQQNLAFAIQELSREIAESEGAVAAEEALEEYAERFPKVRRVLKLKGRHIGVELSQLVKAGKYGAAHRMITAHRDFWPSLFRLHDASTHLYYTQARPFLDAKDWNRAIDIFAKGYREFPANSKLKTNLEFCWMSLTKEVMDDKEWSKAVDLHKEAVKAAPWSIKLRNNLRYCESMLEKETK